MTSIFTATPLSDVPRRAGDVIRSARAVLGRIAPAQGGDSITSPRRGDAVSRSSVCRCVLAVLAALLALPAAALGADHRGGTFLALATRNAGTADPQVNATSQYWDLYQVTHDGLTAFRKTSGPAANSVVPDLATRLPRTADGGRTWTLTLRRGVRYSNGARVGAGRRAVHVRAAVQGRTARRPSRSTARSTAPRRACRTPRPARSSAAWR